MNPDWSKAPEWADELAANPMQELAFVGGKGYSYLIGNGGIVEWGNPCAFKPGDFKLVQLRPKSWNGEGLPPVGITCEYIGGKHELPEPWPVEIIHHYHGGSAMAAAFLYTRNGGTRVAASIAENFRAIRTPEQIAADERLHAIRNVLTELCAGLEKFNVNVDCSHAIAATVEAMHDAGYRKPGEPMFFGIDYSQDVCAQRDELLTLARLLAGAETHAKAQRVRRKALELLAKIESAKP